MKKLIYILLAIVASITGCRKGDAESGTGGGIIPDTNFLQDYAIKYYASDTGISFSRVLCDRNGYIQILGTGGLYRPGPAEFLVPGNIVNDNHYKPLSDKKISGLALYDGQLVYADEKAVFANAWAGKMYYLHLMPDVRLISSGRDFNLLMTDGVNLELVNDKGIIWKGRAEGDEEVRDICYYPSGNAFFLLGKRSIMRFDVASGSFETFLKNDSLCCMALYEGRLFIGMNGGISIADPQRPGNFSNGSLILPSDLLTVIREINGSLWLGSDYGAMRLRDDGRFDYYSSERWLPPGRVTDISAGPEGSVLILTEKGLGQICYNEMTLRDKAQFYEKQVRERHIRHGLNATISGLLAGDLSGGSLEDSDNDGLWTSMYLAAEAFRYSVTRDSDALFNTNESLDAMERLFTINGIPGFPSRSFERRGYKYDDSPWRRASDEEWDWKSTTSSDEAIGHMFAYGVIAELVDDAAVKGKAIMLMDTLMSHILKNDLYLIDWDGKPTRWGRWNPEYVNSFPLNTGDRKLNSSNIISMLQTAYRFTGKAKYRDKALDLMLEEGYFENLMRPMKEIGAASEDASELSRLLSDGWNHSDDEMYFLGYWGLYRYALNDTLKTKYKEAILDHWRTERPEKDALWNIIACMTGEAGGGLNDAAWYLREYPLDLISWEVKNSGRKDLQRLSPNFRNQLTAEVLPPDELPITRHNANRFIYDGGNGGSEEYSAGDIWLLPYWLGRYLGVIDTLKTAGN